MAGGLFHYKLDTSEDRAYSLKKEDYPRLPLFDPDAPATKRRYLDDRIKGLAEPYAKACLATLNTIHGKAYKKYLQEKLTAWFALFPENRAASKERSGPGAAKDSDGERDEGRDDGEEGRIVGEAPELD